MREHFKTLAALAEDPDLVPSTHKVADNQLSLQFWWILSPLLASLDLWYAHGVHTYVQAKYTHRKKISLRKEF